MLYTYKKVKPVVHAALACPPLASTSCTLPHDTLLMACSGAQSGKDQSIIYFWQGNASSADEKGASALLTVELDNELKGVATQVRYVVI